MIREGSCEDVTFQLRFEYQRVNRERILEAGILGRGSCKYKDPDMIRYRLGLTICHECGGQSRIGKGLH